MTSETFTFQDLIESESGVFAPAGELKEKVVKAAAETATPDNILDGLIPPEWKKPIGKLIENFAEHPEKFEKTILGNLGGKLPKPQETATQPPAQPQQSPAQPQPQKQLPDFETIYSKLTAGIEQVIEIQGDMPLSEILKELKEETYIPILKQMYVDWTT